MKKRLLFVTLYLQTGGVEKSLLSLLHSLNYDNYNVDLLLFDHQGALFKEVPSEVNILPPLFETYSTPLLQAVPTLIKLKKYRLLRGKILAACMATFSKGVGTGSRWFVYRSVLPELPDHYDVAISYIDFFCNYYVAEKVKADKKIVYNHMNYKDGQKGGWPCPRLEKESFSVSDHIVTVAESSREALISFFPEFEAKIQVIHNTISLDTIQTMSKETPCDVFQRNKKTWNIVTVARLAEEKGVLLAIEACKQLVNEGYDLCWFIIGNGLLRSVLEKKIIDMDLQDHFVLLGEQANPYPYMNQCDIYVQPSKTEAHCVAVEEAIALACSIVATNIPSFQHQLNNTGNAKMVPPNAQCLANGIKDCMDAEYKPQVASPTDQLSFDKNMKEVEKFFHLIEK